jgi:hypothetical protein
VYKRQWRQLPSPLHAHAGEEESPGSAIETRQEAVGESGHDDGRLLVEEVADTRREVSVKWIEMVSRLHAVIEGRADVFALDRAALEGEVDVQRRDFRGSGLRAATRQLGLEPVQTRQVAQIVVAQQVHQPAEGDRAILRQLGLALKLLLVERLDRGQSGLTGSYEIGDGLQRIHVSVTPLLGQFMAEDSLEPRMMLVTGASDADVIDQGVEVEHMAGMLTE